MNTKKGKGKEMQFKNNWEVAATSVLQQSMAAVHQQYLYVFCQEADAGVVSAPKSFCTICKLVRWPFLSVLRMHSAVWPRLLIPHCKEQQLCFVCEDLCTACSLIRQGNPLFVCSAFSIAWKGDFLFPCSESCRQVCGTLQCRIAGFFPPRKM